MASVVVKTQASREPPRFAPSTQAQSWREHMPLSWPCSIVASLCYMHNNFKSTFEHETRLTGSVHSMQDKGWNRGGSFELKAGQWLLCMRLLSF